MTRALYICYFWLREPLVQTQVLPYLREIGKDGTEISLLTFESTDRPMTSEEYAVEKQKLASEGINWEHLTYHKSPSVPATLYDVIAGAFCIRKLIDQLGIDVLHGRVHVPTLMGALGRKLSRRKPKLIFDIRGFFPEEYVDAGVWKKDSWLFHSAKRVERWLLHEADGFVVLTERARDILFPGSRETGRDTLDRPVEVIPCCVDLDRFDQTRRSATSDIRDEVGNKGRYTIAYVGALGGWYLTDEMIRLFAVAREIDASTFAMILTKRDHDTVKDGLRSIGYTDRDFFVGAVEPVQLPAYLEAADAGISLIKACYSKQASSPTKVAEYLAAGLPVIANRGIGDVDLVLDGEGVGAMLDGFTDADLHSAVVRARELAGGDRQRFVAVAKANFDLQAVGGERYRRLYRRLTSN
jgi:glycosyltransferase involved in cell wall biosynthesis